MKRHLASAVAVSFTFGIAAIALETPPGEVQTSFDSQNQISEFCSLPRILDVAATTQGAPAFVPFLDAEKNTAKKICRADFYDNRESTPTETATVTCPKLNSTNPGLMIHELPDGMTREQFLRNECIKPKKRAGDLIAKYKQSVSCSYTPAILSYPRMARILKSEAELPFTAYRSMDRLEHLEIATLAKDQAAQVGGPNSLIAQTWRGLYAAVASPRTYGTPAKRTALFRDDFTLLYGALVPDLSGDEIYWEANGSAAGDRVANFQRTASFAMVANPRPVSEWGGPRSASVATIQKLVLLREMGDLIVLDTLLNQQDRFGNLHFRPYYVKVGADGSLTWKKGKAKLVKNPQTKKDELVWDAAELAAMTAQGYANVKRMLMNDNDCGVAKENRMARAGISAKVKHLHPETYLGVQRMAKLAKWVDKANGTKVLEGPLVDYLKSDLLFTTTDVKSVVGNLHAMAKDFKKRCTDGALHLDADVAQYLGKVPAVDSRALCAAN